MQALKQSRLFEQIAEILERRIRSREVSEGEELPSERELMKQFGVGRTAVREALFHLQRMGLVELRSGAKARVAAPSPTVVMSTLAGSARYLLSAPEGVRHFQTARTLFETGLVRDAARLAKKPDIARLRVALNANEEAIGDIHRFERSDVDFHYAIATIPGNPIYPALHSAILEWLMDQRHVTLSHPGQNRTAFEAHHGICEAIAAGDGELSAQRMRTHLEQVNALYWKVREEAA